MFPRSNDRSQSYNSQKNNQDTFLADFRKSEDFFTIFRGNLHIHQGRAKQCKTFFEAFSAEGHYSRRGMYNKNFLKSAVTKI